MLELVWNGFEGLYFLLAPTSQWGEINVMKSVLQTEWPLRHSETPYTFSLKYQLS